MIHSILYCRVISTNGPMPFGQPSRLSWSVRLGEGIYSGAHQFEMPDASTVDEVRQKPALAIWGEADRTLHAEHFLPLFMELFPSAPVHWLPGVGHYCLEDAPDEIGHLIADFIQEN
ncbi:hypothetical protein WMW72_12830 [Paenibacillus filicis]|uniref:Alpha/beta hydrolase n=1 Tax=Paenibacillus filicis TaxID=669464 RepID=A0ABU9DKL8_9BACL